MDADLARVAAGLSVSPATEEAATSVLAGAADRHGRHANRAGGAGAPPATAGRPSRYYDYEPPRPAPARSGRGFSRRSCSWRPPWRRTTSTRRSRTSSRAQSPISVPFVEGKLQTAGGARRSATRGSCRRCAGGRTRTSTSVACSTRIPAAGTRVDKESTVVIFVSSGKAKTTVPDVVGESRDDAVAALTAANLEVDVSEVYSEKEPGTVTAQKPARGNAAGRGRDRAHQRLARHQAGVGAVGRRPDARRCHRRHRGGRASSSAPRSSRTRTSRRTPSSPRIRQAERCSGPARRSRSPSRRDRRRRRCRTSKGSTSAAAKATLRAAGLQSRRRLRGHGRSVREDGIVLVQSPGAGHRRRPGSTP